MKEGVDNKPQKITQEQEETFKKMIADLDQALTGHSYEDCLHTFIQVKHTIMQVLEGELYYLSDGGYSRLFWNIWDKEGGVRLSSESRMKIKEAFYQSCLDRVSELESFLLKIQNEVISYE